MPPARRPLKALGSLQLGGYANNPTRVIAELAFIADAQVNIFGESGQRNDDAPLEVQFEEFVDGVNSRGRGTNTRQRKMTAEQAAAVLLVTVQKGHVELTVRHNDPHTIDVIRVLPEAKRILAAFLPKLRGYGDIPYDQQYRGAIALAKRHFFPNGKPPTKKELMTLLLQSYQEKQELSRRPQPQLTKALGVQTSLITLDASPSTQAASGENASDSEARMNSMDVFVQSDSQSGAELPNNEITIDAERASVASEADSNPYTDIGDDHDLLAAGETRPIQLFTCTPARTLTRNPYMTPVSNLRLRRVNHAMDTPSSPLTEVASDEECHERRDRRNDALCDRIPEPVELSLYQVHGGFSKDNFLEREKAEIQRKFDSTKKLLEETEQFLQEANANNSRLQRWGDALSRQVDFLNRHLAILFGASRPLALEEVE